MDSLCYFVDIFLLLKLSCDVFWFRRLVVVCISNCVLLFTYMLDYIILHSIHNLWYVHKVKACTNPVNNRTAKLIYICVVPTMDSIPGYNIIISKLKKTFLKEKKHPFPLRRFTLRHYLLRRFYYKYLH